MVLMFDMFRVQLAEGENCILQGVRKKDGVTEYDFCFNWTKENARKNDGFVVSWTEQVNGVMYKWDSSCKLHRDIWPHWADKYDSMLSKDAPVTCIFDGKDTNRYCWALSECHKYIVSQNGIDQDAQVAPQFSFQVGQYTNQYETQITLYVDKRQVSLRTAVEDVAVWWEKDFSMTPVSVPEDARKPLYSFWYSYGQDISEAKVEEECRRAKALGLEICIVDDGWQTENHLGGYGYCGDWQPAPNKFPDMAEHVKRVHEIGMKYLLWYSMPMIGYHSINYEKFKDMLLRHDPELSVAYLDPRYQEVRVFLRNVLKKALLEWNLDGFKLDFIDSWSDSAHNAPYNEKMDIPALQDAVDTCIADIVQELLRIKPDLLLEFRQQYIGPGMKQFGNMFRVEDCAGNYLKNRVSILDLRMLMGNQAVHSDMLLLAPFEDPAVNALQIISCMFGVVQYSGRLEKLDEKNIEMTRFWITFLKEHSELLQSRNLETYEAHLLYTWAKTQEGNECAVGVYAIDKCVKPDPADTIYIANGCMSNRVLVELSGSYQVQALDCFGHEVYCQEQILSGIKEIEVPVGGLLVMKKQNFL